MLVINAEGSRRPGFSVITGASDRREGKHAHSDSVSDPAISCRADCTTKTDPWGAAISSVRCTESRESMERCPGSATRQCIYNVEAATAVLGWLFVTYVPYNAHFVFVDDDIDHRVLVNVDAQPCKPVVKFEI